MKISARLFLILALSLPALAQVVPGPPIVAPSPPTSQITGSLQTATGGTVTNGTLNFLLSQPAVVSGTSSVSANTVSCYTSTAGNVVGVPDPLVAPVLSANLASGTLPAATYFVKFVYVGPGGTASVPSPEATVILSSQGTLNVNAPAIQPAAATGFFAVYISTSSGTETLQGAASSWTQFQQSTPLVAGGALPASNNTSCNVWFSDTLIPTGTFYTVSLVNKNGSTIAGFPQTWCTFGGAGGTINVSQGAPTGNCGTNGVFYPTPIFAVPANNGQQSISGPLAVLGPLTPITDATASLGTSSLRWNINSYTLSNTNPGVFTNSAVNSYVTSQLNSFSIASEWATLFGGANNSTNALGGGCAVPTTATVFECNGVVGMATSATGAQSAGVGVFGSARGLAANANLLGGNFIASDTVGNATSTLYGVEADVNVTNVTSIPTGVLLNGAWTVQPTNASGIEITKPQGGAFFWVKGLRFDTGATTTPDSNNAALFLFPVASGLNQPSQGLTFVSGDPAAGNNLAQLYLQANGSFLVSTSKTGSGLAANGFFANGGFYQLTETTAPGNPASTDTCYGDSTAHAIKCGYNGVAFSVVPLVDRTQTWTAAQTLPNTVLSTGVGQGSGFKHQRFTGNLGGTCPTAAAIGAACTSANLNWTAAFADNNYTVTCSLVGAMTAQPHIVSVTYQAAGAGITLTIAADTAVATNVAPTGFTDCVAIHD